MLQGSRRKGFTILLLFLLPLVACISLAFGGSPIALADIVSVLYQSLGFGVSVSEDAEIIRKILFDIRIPRMLLAILAGAALSVVGAVFQCLLRNPLAEPYILGVSGGAALGAVIGFILGLGSMALGYGAIQVLSFLGGSVAIFVAYGIGYRRGRLSVFGVILAGVILNSFFNAVILLIYWFANPVKVKGIMFWLLGDLGGMEHNLWIIAAIVLVGCSILYSYSKGYNILVMDEDLASSSGIDVEHLKRVSFLLASFITAAVVSAAGLIAFVGLIVPHTMRLLIGPDHRWLLPVSAIGGSIFLLSCDVLARVLIAPMEIPIGVITSILGGPFFLFILVRNLNTTTR